GETQRLRGPEVDDELKAGRLFDGEIGRPGAFENFVDVGRGAVVRLGHVRPGLPLSTAGQQRQARYAPALDELTPGPAIHRSLSAMLHAGWHRRDGVSSKDLAGQRVAELGTVNGW